MQKIPWHEVDTLNYGDTLIIKTKNDFNVYGFIAYHKINDSIIVFPFDDKDELYSFSEQEIVFISTGKVAINYMINVLFKEIINLNITNYTYLSDRMKFNRDINELLNKHNELANHTNSLLVMNKIEEDEEVETQIRKQKQELKELYSRFLVWKEKSMLMKQNLRNNVDSIPQRFKYIHSILQYCGLEYKPVEKKMKEYIQKNITRHNFKTINSNKINLNFV